MSVGNLLVLDEREMEVTGLFDVDEVTGKVLWFSTFAADVCRLFSQSAP